MKGTIFILFLLMAFGFSNPSQQFIPDNPLPIRLGDPYILKASDNRYYMVGTGGVRNGFKMYSSSDLKSWNDEGQIYQGNTLVVEDGATSLLRLTKDQIEDIIDNI